ncbi:Electron-transferring-flavoprotein dehydrogenase [Magnetococcus marinus MC-1]|uniref:Electron transfer flavoprotein-ubiquinone oxidoreductase n=1 Tax=Magnetococcus marinus (strain ATCC BAA-1437 / JCM 17883 / MC-1) TaxID=156889 RepID=A0LDX9_MAGMM|nr:electron-transfer flavoprotein:ubiquinone oxidoreductase [Magnetococcus marinus]ABK46172.1 Electron-transferring-flavoprotein dehydrogenase [Magnetococcus marinus MC-1]
MTRETLHYDVAIVGAGPAGLATAIAILQRASQPISLCILEKAARVGGHQLSGALVEPDALDLLFGTYAAPPTPPPLLATVQHATTQFLTKTQAIPLPHPKKWQDHGAQLYPLGGLCRWLADHAESLGAEIFPGFTAVELLRDGQHISGVVTGAMGLDRHGGKKPTYQPGVAIHAKVTVLAEGARGFLTQPLLTELGLNHGCPPPTYGLGMKELWSVPKSVPGTIRHTLGWPLERVHGGGFIYHLPNQRIALGLVVGLDYQDPTFDPYGALQRWKQHATLAPLLEGGTLLGYGARAVSQGGWLALPKLYFHGGLLVGDGAGFLNPARLKGVKGALHSGVLAATAIVQALAEGDGGATALRRYQQAWEASDLAQTLKEERNVRAGFRMGGKLGGMAVAAWTGLRQRGENGFSLRWQQEDRARLRPWPSGLDWAQPMRYDTTPTGHSVEYALATSGLSYEEDQPIHLQLRDATLPARQGARFGFPELRYCPGRVFEVKRDASGAIIYLRHGGNCLQCKSCDIKDPFNNIHWTPPEGGNGPDYRDM